MKRSAIPLVGILCLAIWACVQPAPAPPPVVTSGLSSVSCGAGDDLLNHIHYTNFMPVYPFTTEPSPSLGAPQVDPHIQSDLAAAFTANSAFSRNELCTLDGLFINTAQCSSYAPSSCGTMQDTDVVDNSWGFRTQSNHKYVAISLGMWRCPQGSTQDYCAPTFTQFHQRLATALLDRTAGISTGIKPIFKVPPGIDTTGLAVLTAVAHERGHIWWWEMFVKPPGSLSISNTAAFCGGIIYPGGLWPAQAAPRQAKAVDIPAGRYVTFGELSPNSPVSNSRSLFRSGDAASVIDGIYSSGQYPSLLAAYSPDEDFVEAFEWSVLRNGPLRDLTVNVAGVVDRPILKGGVALPKVEAKLRCFDALSH